MNDDQAYRVDAPSEPPTVCERSHAVRYLPAQPFPAYVYVPGHSPHPTSDPAGHSYGLPEEPVAVPDPLRRAESPAFLRGVDLFNAGYFWEAHEVWEQLWHACGRSGTVAEFLKGLIKLAAAGVKRREGRPAGVVRHARRAGELFRSAAQSAPDSVLLGLDLRELESLTGRIEAQSAAGVDDRVFDRVLRPRLPDVGE